MEKKQSRSVQPLSKGLNSSDSKVKLQDGASGKLWPRGGRRREPAGGSLATKPSNNNVQQRKTFDKRPRQRGTANPNAGMGRAETARLDDDYEAELGSVFVPGSKKQSLNHLLNFVYTSHLDEQKQQGRHSASKGNRLIITKKHKYNKEHFLQANCQFIVNSSGNYQQYMHDPDALVDWNLIEQINVQVSEFPSCPICLYPPIAAKMTRCGHIYCWSCLLHYLSLSDKTWRKCPICYESIHKQDLKSVVTIPHNTFNTNDTITFKLMKRAKGSLVAYPATTDANNIEENVIFNLSQQGANDAYSKLLIANTNDILSIVQREFDELKQHIADNGQCPENCFAEQALVHLEERKVHILEGLNANISKELNLNDKDGELDGATGGGRAATSGKYHYFYQASDGQHIYLHAINARMLEHTYGSLQMGPKTLTGKILEKEGGSMTEDLRKRLRYLQHLPLTCQFEVAEIQLKNPLVSRETLDMFNEQIEIRKRRRQKRAREEKKREKRIADEENRIMGKTPTPINNLHIESELQFPCFDGRARTESSESEEGTMLSTVASTPSSSLNIENDYVGPSFATMLSSAKKTPANKWPTLSSTSKQEVETKLINVTGQKMTATVFKSGHRNRDMSESDIDGDYGEFGVPMENRSLGDAIVQALQKVEVNENGAEGAMCGKKKKKKNKQKVLFTTTMLFTDK